MNKEIKLTVSNGRLSNREPFLMALGEDLTLNFLSDYNIKELIVLLCNGAVKMTIKTTTAAVTVPKELCIAGILEVFVTSIVRGESVKQWTVEPIVIKEVSRGISGQLEVEELRQQMAAQSAAYSAIVVEGKQYRERLLAAVEKQLTTQAQRIQALEKAVDILINNPLNL